MPLALFAGIPVRDHPAALPFYEQLFGPPTMHPHETETVWELAEHRSVYIVEDSDIAGHARVMAMVDDLDTTLAQIAARGLSPSRSETYDNGVRKVTFTDPDGNEMAFGAMPSG